ncbi:MAG: D-2-hydroxyacid dehydrogenase [Desulfocapsaceae bacterium]
MNTLLILDDDAPVYKAELQKRNLPDLGISIAENELEAEPYLPEVEIIFGKPLLVAGVVDRTPRLKWVQSTYAGIEQLCRPGLPRSYLLTGIKNLFGSFMREYVFTYILARERSLLQVHRNQQNKIWSRISYRSLADVTIGIIGLGSIGREIARTARHFDMRVLGVKRTPGQLDCVDRLFTVGDMEEFLPQLDYLVLVLPDTAECRHFITEKELGLMNAGAVLINVGRGSSVKQPDLNRALETKQISGAVLDVFEQEPLPAKSPLWAMDNVIITPHNSAYSFPDQVAEIFCANYARFLADSPLDYSVDFDLGY